MKPISQTAFFVNESRARRVDISRDIYAHLWVTDETNKLWDDFTSDIYPYDAEELAVRNRFFLERMTRFNEDNIDAVIVNVGAGFTSYPFLMENPHKFIEIDLEHVINFKWKTINKWLKENRLPKRTVEYIAADLNNPEERNFLKHRLPTSTMNKPSFFLLEGLTYYLKMDVLIDLFRIFLTIQRSGSIIAFDYWEPSNTSHPVFIRFREYWEERFGVKEYNFFGMDFLESIAGYSIVENTNVQEQELIFSDNPVLQDYDKILPENYAILKRCN